MVFLLRLAEYDTFDDDYSSCLLMILQKKGGQDNSGIKSNIHKKNPLIPCPVSILVIACSMHQPTYPTYPTWVGAGKGIGKIVLSC